MSKYQTGCKEPGAPENRYIKVLDNMTEGCQIISPEWRYLYVNEAAAQHGNRTKKKFSGAKMTELYPGIENTEMFRVLRWCMESREQCCMENEFTFPDGAKRWFQLTVQPNVEGILITSIDITDHKRAKAEIDKRIKFERLVSEISSEFVKLPLEKLDKGIENGLSAIGTFSGVDRAYVFLYREGYKLVDNTHEWCAEGVKPQIDNLKEVAINDYYPWFDSHIKTQDTFEISDVDKMPPEAKKDQENFKKQDIQSLLVIPMILGNRLIGFLGFDSVSEKRKWTDDEKSILRLVGEVISNAIERKSVDTKLRKSEQRLIEAQRIAKVGHYVLDVKSGYWSSSAELDTIFGIDKDYKKNVQGWENIIHPDNRKEMLSYLHDHVIGNHQKFDKEYKIINQTDQKEYWVHGVGYLKFDDKGSVVEMLGTIQDISERLKLERELWESQQNMASVLNNTQDGIIRIDRNFRRIYANPAVYKDTGLSEEQYLGKTSREIGFPEELCSLWQEKHESVFHSGEPVTYEFRFLSGSVGEKVYQAIVSPEFNSDGEVETIISIMRDITDLKRAESERNAVIADLEKALAEVKVLRGLIPICARCKKIRDDKGYWNTLESYFTKHSEMSFSHSVCEECADELYGDQEWYRKAK